MNKLINSTFFVALILVCFASSNCLQTQFLSTCYRYGSNSPLDKIESNYGVGNKYVNQDTNNIIYLSFFDAWKECDAACKKSPKYYKCLPSNSSYDKDFGILSNRFVCWIKDNCKKRTYEYREFIHKDEKIFHSSESACNYLCNTVYTNMGHCIINKDFKYHCYYKTVAEEKAREEKIKAMHEKLLRESILGKETNSTTK